MRTIFGVALLALMAAALPAAGAEIDEFRVKRGAVFEFAQKPKVTRRGDRIAIAFETKGYCDVTVAIENAQGRIARHLASGVLGPNAPAPFRKNSKRQAVVWDGKDDQGRYIDEKGSHAVRVSLGLKPRFERTLYHSPYKRFGRRPPLIAPAPEGVYVYEGDTVDNLRLFDHAGNYLRTVYPFPAAKLKQVKGLRWRKTPQDGARMAFKEGYHQSTFLSSGYNAGYNGKTGHGLHTLLSAKHYDGSPSYNAAAAFAVRGSRLALLRLSLNRMATDGTSGGVDLNGPKTFRVVRDGGSYGATARKPRRVFPSSVAFGPGGKQLYLTGYNWDQNHGTGGTIKCWIHGVFRMEYNAKSEPKLFAGSAKQGVTGTAPGQFNVPTAVACDAQGRVYAADYMNDRIQVFNAGGKLLKIIPANKPARLMIHHKTGELYVCSFVMKSYAMRKSPVRVKAILTRYGPFADPRKLASVALPLLGHQENRNTWDRNGGSQYKVALDSWTEPPTLWLAPGSSRSWQQMGLKLLEVGKRKLKLKRDFGLDARKATVRDAPAGRSRQRMNVNPRTGKLYVMEALASHQVVEINPQSGKDRHVELPFSAEDICFDVDGLAYLRTGSIVARYDSRTWREVPWDYGEERRGVHHCGGRAGNVISGLALPGKRSSPWYHGGGFGISPKGRLVVQCFNSARFSPKRDRVKDRTGTLKTDGSERYSPRLYPGRRRWGEIHIWDRHGKKLRVDVVQGMGITDGVAIDNDDNIYVLANPTRTAGGKHVLNPKTETLMKFKPGRGRVISSLGGGSVPVPLKKGGAPKGPVSVKGHYMGGAWVQGAEWFYGGVGFAGSRCVCWNARFALDYFARTFVPEPDHFSIAVLDTAGNLIMRIGKYGNVDDGRPLLDGGGSSRTRSIGGDEVALMHSCYVATHSDRRLFIADAGNRRILSVKLGYHVSERIKLRDVPDRARKSAR